MKKFLSFESFLNEASFQGIDLIVYGNQTADNKKKSGRIDAIKDWFIRNGYAEKIERECPKNSSPKTREDINKILQISKNVSVEDVEFAKLAEADMVKLFVDFVSQKGKEASVAECYSIIEKTDSLLFFLKDVINRPRPYQLAHALDLPLYPLIHTDANSAAYPSGHALDSYNIARYYAQKYPDISAECYSYAEKIAASRVNVGIHYPSDSEISKKISDILWENGLLDE